jgi:peptidoglycan/LPS O-acetylase OafA/YrhL
MPSSSNTAALSENSNKIESAFTPSTDKLAHSANNFDFIRLLAACLVIWYHASCLQGRSTDPLSLLTGNSTDLGALAVSIFFVISGYLITQSFERSKSLLQYAGSRFLRIWPAMFVLCAITACCLGPLVTVDNLPAYFSDNDFRSYFKNCLFLHTYVHLQGVFLHNHYPVVVNGSIWTLPVEAFMYGVTLLLGITRVQKNRFWMTLIFAALVVADMQVFSTPSTVLTPFLWLPPLFATAKFAIMYLAGALYYLYRDSIKLSWQAATLVLFVLAGSYHTPHSRFVEYFCIPYLVMFAAYLPVPYLRNAAKYGDFSYGIYLYGFVVQQSIMHFTQGHISPAKFILLSLAISLVCAFLSWNFVEKPALRLKKYLKQA